MFNITKSLAIILVVVAIAGAGTYALFSDTGTVAGSTFSAGTLNLEIDQNPIPEDRDWVDNFNIVSDDYENYINGLGGFMTYDEFMAQAGLSNLKPGDTRNQVIDIRNIGTVNGKATIQLNASNWSALGDNLVFTVFYNGTQITTGTLAQFNGNTYDLGVLNANTEANVKIVWSVPETAGNDIQGKSVTVDTVFGLIQN